MRTSIVRLEAQLRESEAKNITLVALTNELHTCKSELDASAALAKELAIKLEGKEPTKR